MKKSRRTPSEEIEKIKIIEIGIEEAIVTEDTAIEITIVGGTTAEIEIGSVTGIGTMKEIAAGVIEGTEMIEEIVVIETTGITIGTEIGEAAVKGIVTIGNTADVILAPEPGLEVEGILVEKGALRV